MSRSDYIVIEDINTIVDYGAIILKDLIIGAEEDISSVSVPGRSGDIHFRNKRYKNRERTIDIYFPGGKNDIEEFDARLLAIGKYTRIDSTINPGFYMLGQYKGNFEPTQISVGYLEAVGSFVWDCKPQKYLVEGDNTISLADGETLVNPTAFPAKPVLYVSGSGSFFIGRYQIDILEEVTDMVIDCDLENAYSSTDGTNYNSKIRTYDSNFMQIEAGDNTVAIDSGLTVSCVPRWWTL